MKVGSVTHHLLRFCLTCIRNVCFSMDSSDYGIYCHMPSSACLFLVVVQSVAMWDLYDSAYCKISPAEWISAGQLDC